MSIRKLIIRIRQKKEIENFYFAKIIKSVYNIDYQILNSFIQHCTIH